MNDHANDPLLDARGVSAETGGKSTMTIWRWQRDPRVNFPAPDVVINNRNYWYRSTITGWKTAMAAKCSTTSAPRGRFDHECAA